MAKCCQFKIHEVQKGNKISIERSKVTKRITKFFQVNLQEKKFKTNLLGNFRLRVSNKSNKTINKYENVESLGNRFQKFGVRLDYAETLSPIEKSLLALKRGNLTPHAKKMRKTLIKTVKKMQLNFLG